MRTLRTIANVTLLISLCLVLPGCTQRTILHGMDSARPVPPPKAVKAPSKQQNQVAVWFVKSNSNGNLALVSVERRARSSDDRLSSAVNELLSGPSAAEEKSGLGTEIPRGTVLLGIKRNNDNIELDLSRRFARGGGASSIEARLEQLRRTVSSASSDPVYLNVEGKRWTMSEGEGIEIRQPINR